MCGFLVRETHAHILAHTCFCTELFGFLGVCRFQLGPRVPQTEAVCRSPEMLRAGHRAVPQQSLHIICHRIHVSELIGFLAYYVNVLCWVGLLCVCIYLFILVYVCIYVCCLCYALASVAIICWATRTTPFSTTIAHWGCGHGTPLRPIC